MDWTGWPTRQGCVRWALEALAAGRGGGWWGRCARCLAAIELSATTRCRAGTITCAVGGGEYPRPPRSDGGDRGHPRRFPSLSSLPSPSAYWPTIPVCGRPAAPSPPRGVEAGTGVAHVAYQQPRDRAAGAWVVGLGELTVPTHDLAADDQLIRRTSPALPPTWPQKIGHLRRSIKTPQIAELAAPIGRTRPALSVGRTSAYLAAVLGRQVATRTANGNR